jgi:hypothetical protein
LIDERPAFDPGEWMQRLPGLDLFGALVSQVIGQQISLEPVQQSRFQSVVGYRAPGDRLIRPR